jgi:hypothetical protein
MGSLGSIFCGSRHNSDRHVCGRYRERAVALVSALAMTAKHCDPQEKGEPMAIDAEIEAAVVAMRAVRVKGAKVHEEVMRAYARAAVEAAERARQEDPGIALAERLRRKADRIDPARMRRPCGCLRRGALTSDSDEVCRLL